LLQQAFSPEHQFGPSGNVSILRTAPASVRSTGQHTVTIKQITNGVALDLGGTTNPIGGPLTLSSAEVSGITAGRSTSATRTAAHSRSAPPFHAFCQRRAQSGFRARDQPEWEFAQFGGRNVN